MMSTYARLELINGIDTVVEIIEPPVVDGKQLPISGLFTAEFVATLTDITSVTPQPAQWWTYDGTNFSAPAH